LIAPAQAHSRSERLDLGGAMLERQSQEKNASGRPSGSDAALAAQAQEKRQKQRKNGSTVAWDDSG